jgi:hypothetical protein
LFESYLVFETLFLHVSFVTLKPTTNAIDAIVPSPMARPLEIREEKH